MPLTVLWPMVSVPLVIERIAPPLYVLSGKPVLSPVVRPPVSVSPLMLKSPTVVLMLKMREFCCASMVNWSAPGPVIDALRTG